MILFPSLTFIKASGDLLLCFCIFKIKAQSRLFFDLDD